MLVLTLLFLGVVGLRRTWDLRGYTGDALALLSGRNRAYSYFHTERLLSQMARANQAESLIDALAAWTTQLWQPPELQSLSNSTASYIDGHRKPVYTEGLIPRGLVGRGLDGHSNALDFNHSQAHSHRDNSLDSGRSRTCPNLHTTLVGTRKHHPRFLTAFGAGEPQWYPYVKKARSIGHIVIRGYGLRSAHTRAALHCESTGDIDHIDQGNRFDPLDM
jgi:hypothetical protein